jgi:hypothetical protein
MADLISTIWNYKIMGIQIIPIVIFVGIVFLAFKLIKYVLSHRESHFKKKELKEEVKDYNYEDCNFGFPVDKKLVFRVNQGKILEATIHKGVPTIHKERGKIQFKYDDIDKNSWKLKCRNHGLLWRILACFNRGIWYVVADENLITDMSDEIRINPNADYVIDNGVKIFGSVSKNIIDNISYLKNTENISEALINFIPKMEYLESMTSSNVAIKREIAEIEKEKYKGQVED